MCGVQAATFSIGEDYGPGNKIGVLSANVRGGESFSTISCNREAGPVTRAGAIQISSNQEGIFGIQEEFNTGDGTNTHWLYILDTAPTVPLFDFSRQRSYSVSRF